MKHLFPSVVMLVCGLILGFGFSPRLQNTLLTKANDRVIDELGVAAAEMTSNTEMLMKFNHFLDKHTEADPVGGCLICNPNPDTFLTTRFSPEANVDSRPNQTLVEDAEEIYHSIQSLRFGLLIQSEKLEHTLERLEEGCLCGCIQCQQ